MQQIALFENDINTPASYLSDDPWLPASSTSKFSPAEEKEI